MDKDISMMAQVLSGILNPDANIRTQAAAKIVELNQNLGGLSLCLLQVASLPSQNDNELQIKETALVILRRILKMDSYEKWKAIDNNLKEQIKAAAMKQLATESNQKLKKRLVDVLTEIIEKITDSEENWPDLKQLCINLLNQNLSNPGTDFVTIESVLRLFKDAIGFLFDDLIAQGPILYNFFNQIFSTNITSLKVEAVSCINELICYCSDDDELKKFQPFIKNILQVVYECFTKGDEDNLKKVLETVIETSTIEPDMLGKHFNDIFTLFSQIVGKKDYDDDKLRELGFELIINLIEEKPKLILKDKEKKNFKTLIEMIYQYGLEFDKSDDPKWSTPNGFNYEEVESVDEDTVSFAQSLLDRLVECCGLKDCSVILSDIIKKLIDQNDWSYKYIGIISLTGLSQYEEDMAGMEMTFNLIFSLTKNENNKVRYAAINCINKLSTNYNPHFSKKYIDTLIPLLYNLYKTENILRIKCEIVETINCLIQFASSELISKYLSNLFEFLFGEFILDIPLMLRKCIADCILEVINTMEDECKPYADKSFNICSNYFSQIYQSKSMTFLYGVLIEILTSLGPYTTNSFNQIVPQLLNIIIEIIKGNNFQEIPDKLEYQNALEKLLPIVQEKYKNLLPNLIQVVFILVSTLPKIYVSSSPDNTVDIKTLLANEDENKLKKIDLGTTEIEDFISSISLLNTIIETLGDEFIAYAEEAEQKVMPLISYEFNAKVRRKATKILPNLLPLFKEQGIKTVKAKTYIQTVINQIQKETDNKTCLKMFIRLEEIINHSEYILNKQELNNLFEQLLKNFQDVEKRRRDLLAKKEKDTENMKIHAPDDDSDDDDINDLLEEDIENLEDVEEEIGETIGYLFKTHKDLCDDIINIIITRVLPEYTKQNASTFESKMGLYIIDDMIEFLGQEKLMNIWNDLFTLLIKMAVRKEDNLRQAACYGLGIFAKFTKVNFNFYSENMLKTLQEAMKFKCEDPDEEEDWKLAFDNIIASLGKIMAHQNQDETVKKYFSDIMKIWISNLPIKTDEAEQEEQHNWLAEIVMNKSELIPEDHLGKAFSALVKIYLTKLSTEEINQKIEKIFTNAKNTDKGKAIIDSVYQSGDSKIKNKVKKLIEDKK
ncbi:MAG: hypothetical protein MJ252_07440 [archaeon]|nr:hypothetical protein [archaeon]